MRPLRRLGPGRQFFTALVLFLSFRVEQIVARQAAAYQSTKPDGGQGHNVASPRPGNGREDWS
ncbi:MAG TPA: hypothetical protein VI455_05145, partial [Terriglobia bacterium]